MLSKELRLSTACPMRMGSARAEAAKKFVVQQQIRRPSSFGKQPRLSDRKDCFADGNDGNANKNMSNCGPLLPEYKRTATVTGAPSNSVPNNTFTTLQPTGAMRASSINTSERCGSAIKALGQLGGNDTANPARSSTKKSHWGTTVFTVPLLNTAMTPMILWLIGFRTSGVGIGMFHRYA